MIILQYCRFAFLNINRNVPCQNALFSSTNSNNYLLNFYHIKMHVLHIILSNYQFLFYIIYYLLSLFKFTNLHKNGICSFFHFCITQTNYKNLSHICCLNISVINMDINLYKYITKVCVITSFVFMFSFISSINYIT